MYSSRKAYTQVNSPMPNSPKKQYALFSPISMNQSYASPVLSHYSSNRLMVSEKLQLDFLKEQIQQVYG